MISPAVIAAANAVSIAEVVGRVVELKRDYGLCPFHNERTPSLHVYRARNVFCCFGCGAKGGPIEFLRRFERVDFKTAVSRLVNGRVITVARDHSARERAPREAEVPALVSELWDGATSPNLASFCLSSRGIAPRALPEALRGHPRVWCAEAHEYRPAMLAAITDGLGRITAVQRTWLTARIEYDGHTQFLKGARPPDLGAPKKCLGSLGSGAVRLSAAGAVLGLAEGVESALAAANLYRLPVWATCGAHRLGSVELPEVVQRVIIFGDRGSSGEAAAAKAESLYRRRGYQVQVEYPAPAYSDFAEQVMR